MSSLISSKFKKCRIERYKVFSMYILFVIIKLKEDQTERNVFGYVYKVI